MTNPSFRSSRRPLACNRPMQWFAVIVVFMTGICLAVEAQDQSSDGADSATNKSDATPRTPSDFNSASQPSSENLEKPSELGDEKALNKLGPKVAPDKFREVDDAASLMVWLVVVSGLGGLAILVFITVGARRIRRLTRSRSLQTQYDELEYLRIKHRREIEQLSGSRPPKREPRS